MSSENRNKLVKLYERADAEVKARVREILGGEPSKKFLKSIALKKIDRALALLSGLKGSPQTQPQEYLETEAFWDSRILTPFGQALIPRLLEAVTRITRAKNLGKHGMGVSPSLKESIWEIYSLLALLLAREGFDPELAEFCGLSNQDYNLRLEMGRYQVQNEEELKKAKAIHDFLEGLSKEDQELAFTIIKATGEAQDGMWWTSNGSAEQPQLPPSF